MAKALFNGECYVCKSMRPFCAVIYSRNWGKRTFSDKPLTVCAECLKGYRGGYRLDERHKAASRVRPNGPCTPLAAVDASGDAVRNGSGPESGATPRGAAKG